MSGSARPRTRPGEATLLASARHSHSSRTFSTVRANKLDSQKARYCWFVASYKSLHR